MGLLTSYARARAEGLGVDCKVGIAERAERSIILLTALILTGLGVNVLPYGLVLLAVVSTVTVGQRMWHVRKLLAT
jgi:CDP-diacylglycerol--glycerol-3-phosphate 3-phosphatidyltransferase